MKRNRTDPYLYAWIVATLLMLLAFARVAQPQELPGPPEPRKAYALEVREVQNPDWGWGEALIIGTALTDLGSTELALSRGGEELNPLLKRRSARLAVKALAAGAGVWVYRTLRQRGHDGWARFVAVFLGALWGGATAWNIL